MLAACARASKRVAWTSTKGLTNKTHATSYETLGRTKMNIGAALVALTITAGTAYVLSNERREMLISKESEKKDLDIRLTKIEKGLENLTNALDKNRLASTKGQVDVVLGAQWGDEGKGKLVDILAQKYDICARVAGGSNAGHTIVVNGVKFKFHLLPSGMLNPNSIGVVGNGVVVHIPTLLQEISDLEKVGVNFDGRLKLSDRAHIVFDFHQQIDGLNEGQLGRNKLGTTKKGIGPAYSSKILRNGLRLGDLEDFDEFEKRLTSLVDYYKRSYGDIVSIDLEAELAYYKGVRESILGMTIDTIEYINSAYDNGKRILIEGANATMLDIDFGTYPFVTSSNPSVGSVCTGLGVAPVKLSNIYGTVKAYCTRVGEGPFPTELHDHTGKFLLERGGEWGTTTGRPRRCGWLDIPQMKYSQLVNGYTALNLTKLDVLTGLEEVKIGVSYKMGDKYLTGMPSNLRLLSNLEVVYETLPGWTEDLSECRNFDDLPANAKAYVKRVEELIEVPIRWVGVGAGRECLVDCQSR